MRPIQAGKLRHLITIQKPTPGAATALGTRPLSWSNFATAFASIEPLSGREAEVAKSYTPTVSHKITLRYVSGVLATFRISYGGRLFNISAALNIEERQRMLVLMCAEQVVT